MIRLLHTSDWHLGRFLFGKSLLEDQAAALDRIVEIVDTVRPHAILIAGDVFDRPLPPEMAVRLFDDFLSRVVMERGRPVFLIPGNHDSAERLGFASRLLRDRGFTIFSKPEDALKPVRVRGDDGEEAMIFGIPFVEPVQIGRLLGRDDIRSFDQATRALTTEMKKQMVSGVPSVLLCHAFVVGGEASDSERDLYVGGSSHVDVGAFEGFAYTALGHLHKPQRAGHDRVRYSGSLYTYSKSEVEHAKSASEIRLTKDGSCEVVSHAIDPARRLRYLEDTLEILVTAGSKDERKDDYILAGLTDPGPVVDALARLRAVYPNLLHVSRVQGSFRPEEIPIAAKLREREAIDELDLFSEFVQETTGQALTADERSFVLDSIRELDRPEGAST
ncbi:MAG: exonuclease SbcCD subunit D [Bdellovibrionota bacterium]